jgi:PH (Pleckstrin Homology) domain-containing protein
MALEFRAPWSGSLKTASRIAVIILLGIAVAGIVLMPARLPWVRVFMVAAPACFLVSALLFMVSGYRLSATALEIQRPLWTTTYALAELVSVAGDTDALHGSLRVFGNGGLFSFTGIFWNKRLGLFHAYGTDPERAVVMKFRTRMIVVTPDDTQHFIVRVRTHLATREYQ